MGACGSKPKKKKSTSDSPAENHLKHDAIVIRERNSTANGFQQTSASYYSSSQHHNSVVSEKKIQFVSKIGSNPPRQSVLSGNFVQQEAISTGFSPAQVSLPKERRPSYTPVYKTLATGSAIPSTRSSISTGLSPAQVALPTKSPFPYTPVRTSQANGSPKSSTRSSGTTVSAGQYDLSKKAYVLVLHHYKFKNGEGNREGSGKDMDKIRRFFRDYRVGPLNVNENQTVGRVSNTMDGIARKDFSNYSCLITIIMSHGHLNDQIAAYDGVSYCFEEQIVEKCASNRTLDGKPKIFIVQACRGDSEVVTDSKKTQNKKSDVLTFQSTYKGYVAYRDPKNGSFFIQNFFELLDQYRQEDICNINKHLNRVFTEKGISQTPTMTSTLQKDLMFGDLRKS